MQTIQDWEDARFAREAEAEIAAIPTVEPERAALPAYRPPTLRAWAGRHTSGLAVQGLVDTATGETFITVDVGGRTQTFGVAREDAADAFAHPYAYGATLAIR